MKVYSVPEEIPLPEIDYSNYDWKKYDQDCEDHKLRLKHHLVSIGYNGDHTGLVYSTPMGDGFASYMIAESKTKTILVHLPYADAWHDPDVEYLPKKEVLKRAKQQASLPRMFT